MTTNAALLAYHNSNLENLPGHWAGERDEPERWKDVDMSIITTGLADSRFKDRPALKVFESGDSTTFIALTPETIWFLSGIFNMNQKNPAKGWEYHPTLKQTLYEIDDGAAFVTRKFILHKSASQASKKTFYAVSASTFIDLLTHRFKGSLEKSLPVHKLKDSSPADFKFRSQLRTWANGQLNTRTITEDHLARAATAYKQQAATLEINLKKAASRLEGARAEGRDEYRLGLEGYLTQPDVALDALYGTEISEAQLQLFLRRLCKEEHIVKQSASFSLERDENGEKVIKYKYTPYDDTLAEDDQLACAHSDLYTELRTWRAVKVLSDQAHTYAQSIFDKCEVINADVDLDMTDLFSHALAGDISFPKTFRWLHTVGSRVKGTIVNPDVLELFEMLPDKGQQQPSMFGTQMRAAVELMIGRRFRSSELLGRKEIRQSPHATFVTSTGAVCRVPAFFKMIEVAHRDRDKPGVGAIRKDVQYPPSEQDPHGKGPPILAADISYDPNARFDVDKRFGQVDYDELKEDALAGRHDAGEVCDVQVGENEEDTASFRIRPPSIAIPMQLFQGTERHVRENLRQNPIPESALDANKKLVVEADIALWMDGSTKGNKQMCKQMVRVIFRKGSPGVDLLFGKTLNADLDHQMKKVRQMPSWPRSWANFSLLHLYAHRNAWANCDLLGQPNTFLGEVALARGELELLGVWVRLRRARRPLW